MHSIINKGFTLIELVVSMAIISALSIFSFAFITIATEVVSDIELKNKSLSEGVFIVKKLEKELNNALPNSIKISNSGNSSCIEYLPVVSSGFYSEIPTIVSSSIIKASLDDNVNCTNCGLYAAIYPVDTISIYSELTIKAVSQIDMTTNTITLEQEGVFPLESPDRKIFITKAPVSICQSENNIGIKRELPLQLSNSSYDSTYDFLSNKYDTNKLSTPLFLSSEGLSRGLGVTTVNGVFFFGDVSIHLISQIGQHHEI